jgi:ferredoxin-fold anticodon binding domain-containing protein
MKKYKVIAKVGNEKFVKYNVNNLVLFSKFLDKEFSDWRFFNVFEYTKDGTGSQIANFTKNSRPTQMYL